MTTEIPMDRLAKVYIKIRTRIAELTRDYESQVEALKAQQTQVADNMKDQLREVGALSAKTEFGTVSLVTSTRYFAQDWDAMKTFIMEHDAIDLLEKRVAQGNMKKFLDANPGVVPPGLNTVSEIEVRVTKPQK
jgi:hypothetical protein